MKDGSIVLESMNHFESEVQQDREAIIGLVDSANDDEAEHFMRMFFKYIACPHDEKFHFHNLSKGWANMARIAYRILLSRLKEVAGVDPMSVRSQSARKALCIMQKNYGGK